MKLLKYLPLLFLSCTGYPFNTIYEGKKSMIIYKMEDITGYEEAQFGRYKYAVTDAYGAGYTLFSFNKYSIGDTIYISNHK